MAVASGDLPLADQSGQPPHTHPGRPINPAALPCACVQVEAGGGSDKAADPWCHPEGHGHGAAAHGAAAPAKLSDTGYVPLRGAPHDVGAAGGSIA